MRKRKVLNVDTAVQGWSSSREGCYRRAWPINGDPGESPNMMMLGREVNLPIDLLVGAVRHMKECESDYANELRDNLRAIHEQARHALEVSEVC